MRAAFGSDQLTLLLGVSPTWGHSRERGGQCPVSALQAHHPFFLSTAVVLPDSVGHGLAMEPGGGEAVRHHGTDTGREKEGLSFILSYTNGLQDSINYSELSGP